MHADAAAALSGDDPCWTALDRCVNLASVAAARCLSSAAADARLSAPSAPTKNSAAAAAVAAASLSVAAASLSVMPPRSSCGAACRGAKRTHDGQDPA